MRFSKYYNIGAKLILLSSVILNLMPASEAQDQNAALAQRASQFSSTSFAWSVSGQETHNPLSNQEVLRIESANLAMTNKAMKQRGFPTTKSTGEPLGVLGIRQESKFHSAWSIQRMGQDTLVSGSIAKPINSTIVCQQYYSGGSGLLITDSVNMAGVATKPEPPFAWEDSQDAVHYRSPFGGLDIRPEDFVLLAELNPFDMYGATWTKGPNNTYFGRVAKGDGSPFTISFTLDPLNTDLPSQIDAKGTDWEEHYKVTGWRRVNGGPIPSDVVFTHVSSLRTIRRTWHLISYAPTTAQLTPDMTAVRMMVKDYRLAGTELYPLDVGDPTKHTEDAVVQYVWSGRLPTMGELKDLSDRQHADTAPRKSNLWSTLVPLAVIGIGMVLWVFSRRRTVR